MDLSRQAQWGQQIGNSTAEAIRTHFAFVAARRLLPFVIRWVLTRHIHAVSWGTTKRHFGIQMSRFHVQTNTLLCYVGDTGNKVDDSAWGGTLLSVPATLTVRTAHVDNDLQGRLLGCQQGRRLPQLLSVPLDNKNRSQESTSNNNNKIIFFTQFDSPTQRRNVSPQMNTDLSLSNFNCGSTV